MIYSEVLTDTGREKVRAFELPDTYHKDFRFGHCGYIKSRSRYKAPLLKKAMYLDTETSWNHDKEHPIGWIYQWAFEFNGKLYAGRTPIQFCKMLKKMVDYYKLCKYKKLCIYIHNASYDIAYLKEHLIKFFGEPIGMLATKPHKFINLEFESFIIRDSLVLSNRSLYKWSNDLKSKYRKALGEIDYDVIRYQDSKLKPESDWFYMLSDCMCLKNCVELEMDSDNIQTIPLTSTAYVRRDARELFNEDQENRDLFIKTRLNDRLYPEFLQGYMGAISHGNRHYAGKKVVHPCGHVDFRSFYSSTIECDEDYMVGTPVLLYDYQEKCEKKYTKDDVLKLSENYAMIVTVMLKNPCIRKEVTFPCISTSKIVWGTTDSKGRKKLLADNGRLLRYDGSIVLTMTHLDFKWICKQYTSEKCKIMRIIAGEKGKLPEWLREVTNNYFYKKSALKLHLKKLEKQGASETEIYNAEIDLMKSKNKLNGIYGCTATKPIREEYNCDWNSMEWTTSPLYDIEGKLDKFYNSRNNFMSFQYGCFVTANTRNRLLSIIEAIGYDKVLYCDTDSAFYLKDEETDEVIRSYNEQNLKDRLERGEYIQTEDGKIIEYMALEDEEDDIQEFKFLHSKCYGFYNSKKELKLTIAGVSAFYREDMGIEDIGKRRTREMELGSLDKMEKGFVFEHCGGTTAKYIDAKPYILNIKGHITQIASACIIMNGTKTLKLELDEELLEENVDAY